MVAQDDPSAPSIGFGVRNDSMKNGSFGLFAVKLHAADQRKAGFDWKTVGFGEPAFVIDECGVLAQAALIVVKRANRTRFIAKEDLKSPFQSAVGTFFTRTRLGSCASSSWRPISSRRTSATSPNVGPNPSTNSAIA